MEPFRFATSDGTRIQVYRWLPPGQARATLQIAHGMGEHAARYDAAAAAFTGAGYAVYANDHRGHGHTAEPGKLGWLGKDGWNRVIADAADLTLHVREQHPDVPQVLLGHSMGAMLAQQYLYRFGAGLDAAVLSGSPGLPGRFEGWLSRVVARLERWRLGADAQSPLMQKLLFGRLNRAFADQGDTGYEWLSRDEAQVAAYVRDPLCGFVLSAGSLCDLFDGVRASRDIENVLQIPPSLPLYVFSGSEDPVHAGQSNLDRLLRLYRYHLVRLEHRIYPGGRHEMLNETNREQVIQELLGWLEEVLWPSDSDSSATA